MIKLIDGNNRFRSRWEKLGPNALQILYNESISTIQGTTIIWVWDGHNGTETRKKHFPEYKGLRQPSSDQFHQTMTLFKELLTHSNCLQVSVDGVEADDVIAKISLGSTQKIFIDSNDADFLALESERISVNREPIAGVTAEFVHLFKTLVGDKADGIKGLPGFGEGTWQKLETSEKKLLISHFLESRRLNGSDCSELLGWSKSLASKWDANIDLLDTYWLVTSFFDVPDELISRNLSCGKLDMGAAQLKLAPLFLNMDYERNVA